MTTDPPPPPHIEAVVERRQDPALVWSLWNDRGECLALPATNPVEEKPGTGKAAWEGFAPTVLIQRG